MPEMPEVQGLVDFLGERATGLQITRAMVASFSALKTYDPPIDALVGATIASVVRHGKFIDVATTRSAEPGDPRDFSDRHPGDPYGTSPSGPHDERRDTARAAPGGTDPGGEAGPHLVFHLAKAGWMRWYDQLTTTLIKPGRTPIALRIAFDDGSGFDLTEAGTKKSLAVYVVRDPADVPGIARLGPDPLDPTFDRDTFAALLAARRTQIKGVLRDQSIIAGVGNAYSDEILHAARMSPYALAANLDEAEIDRLFTAMTRTLREAVSEASGKPPADLKDAKRRGMQVHGRRGLACPVCGEEVRSVFFADNSLEYCAHCQTGGKILADRRLSRLLK